MSERRLHSPDRSRDHDLDELPMARPRQRPTPGKVTLSEQLVPNPNVMRLLAAMGPVQRQARPGAGSSAAARPAITHEVTVHTVQLIPDPDNAGPDNIAAAFAAANQIYNPHGLRVVRGERQVVRGARARRLLGVSERQDAELMPDNERLRQRAAESGDTLDPDARVRPEDGPQASDEALDIANIERHQGELTAYWVPHIGIGADAVSVDSSYYNNVDDDHEAIFLEPTASGETFAHELGHVLMRIGHTDLDGSDDNQNGVADEEIVDCDPDNLMQSGSRRTGTELTAPQVRALLTGNRYVRRIDGGPQPNLGRRLSDPVQRKGSGSADASSAPRVGAGTPLSDEVRTGMEAAFGVDFSAVRVQENPVADQLSARAFTQGENIVFAPGTFDPSSSAGMALLGHELTHVVQQRAGRVGTATGPGGFINADPALEAEADRAGDRVARGERAAIDNTANNDAGTSGPVQRAPNITEEQLRRDLTSRGVTDLGNVAAAAAWPDVVIERHMAILDALSRGGGRRGAGAREASGGRRAYAGRIVAAWNRHLDDLGYGGSGGFPTILHFVRHIEELAARQGFARAGSPPSAYLTGIREENMPTVRLAGARVGVNPRNVYFAAAAQVHMDQHGGTEEQQAEAGHGHWVPAGGFRDMAHDMARALERMGYLGRGRRRRDRTDGIPQGGQILAAIRSDLNRMHEALSAQERGESIQGYNADEHREPEMRSWLLGCWSQIEAVPESADDAQSAAVARQLLQAMGQVPGRGGIHHGYGSIDPHGTDHAMGNAIDIYNGRGGTGHFQNFGVRNQYWPFVHRLIQEEGASRGLDPTITPNSIHELPPAQARALSGLIRERGPALRERLVAARTERREARAGRDREASQQATREANARRRSLRSIRQRVRLALQHRAARLNRVRARRVARYYPDELNQRIAREFTTIRDDIGHVPSMGPTEMSQVLTRHESELQAIDREAEAVESEARTEAEQEHAEAIETIQQEEQTALDAEDQRFQEELDALPDAAALRARLDEINTELQSARGSQRRRLLRRRSMVRRRLGSLPRRERGVRRRGARRRGAIERRYDREAQRADRDATREASRRESAADAVEELTPEPEPFEALLAELRDQSETYGEAFEEDRAENVDGFIATRAFERWLTTVSDPDRPIYDQPDVMVNAFNDVHSHDGEHASGEDTHFYGGHHWTVSRREVISDVGAYRTTLAQDMEHRSPEQLERILSIMAESAGGRRLLFEAPDVDFRRALDTRLGGAEPAQQLLDTVRERVVTPFEAPEEGQSESERTSMALRRQLRDRGHYVAE